MDPELFGQNGSRIIFSDPIFGRKNLYSLKNLASAFLWSIKMCLFFTQEPDHNPERPERQYPDLEKIISHPNLQPVNRIYELLGVLGTVLLSIKTELMPSIGRTLDLYRYRTVSGFELRL